MIKAQLSEIQNCTNEEGNFKEANLRVTDYLCYSVSY